MIMSGPKKTKGSLRKTARQVEDQLGVDKTVEDIVDGILSIFDDEDDEEEESSDSIFDSDSDDSSDDSDSGDFGDGDFGGGGSSDDW